ncbi:Hypothetical_protein [Hexamita inflata]|uniref:Hypothetical_protein n=1 Tax=Hexamita inflata TaxID=28002 RepID=A0ABP1KB23_9EUKA
MIAFLCVCSVKSDNSSQVTYRRDSVNYIDVGMIYQLNVQAERSLLYQLRNVTQQLEVSISAVENVFMCISSTLVTSETQDCELLLSSKGTYDLQPKQKYVFIYTKELELHITFVFNPKVHQLVHQEQTKITLQQNISTIANAQITVSSDFKQIVVQATTTGIHLDNESCVISFSSASAHVQLTNLSSFVSFPMMLQNVQREQNLQVQIQSSCDVQIVLIYSVIYTLGQQVSVTTRKYPNGVYFVKEIEENSTQYSIFQSDSNAEIYVCSVPILLRFVVSDCQRIVKQSQKIKTNVSSDNYKTSQIYYSFKTNAEEEMKVDSNTAYKMKLQSERSQYLDLQSVLLCEFVGYSDYLLQVEIKGSNNAIVCVIENTQNIENLTCSQLITKSGSYQFSRDQKFLVAYSTEQTYISIKYTDVKEKQNQTWLIWVIVISVSSVVAISIVVVVKFIKHKKQKRAQNEHLIQE